MAPYSPDGSKIAVAAEKGDVSVWGIDTAELLWEALEAHGAGHGISEARCVSWSPHGLELASCGMDETVKIWEGHSGRLLQSLSGHEHPLGAVTWSPDGTFLASSDWHGQVKIWNASNWRVERELSILPQGGSGADGQRPIAFDRQGQRLAGGGATGVVRVWDAVSGRELIELIGHSGNIRSLSWTPDGDRLASASEDGLIKIWDTANGRELLTLRGHAAWVLSLEWSPCGRQLLSSSHSVRLWDAMPAYEKYGSRRLSLRMTAAGLFPQ